MAVGCRLEVIKTQHYRLSEISNILSQLRCHCELKEGELAKISVVFHFFYYFSEEITWSYTGKFELKFLNL